jgi:hypothetical protein
MSRFTGVTIDGVWNGFVATYTQHSELQVLTAPPLISTSHITTAPVKPFPAYYVFSRSLETALTVEILQIHAFRFYLHSLYRHLFSASLAELCSQPTGSPQFSSFLRTE